MKTSDNISEWSLLLEALHDFDVKASPVGLYAAEEYKMKGHPQPHLKVEWEQCLKPAMKSLGCNPVGRAKFTAHRLSVQFQPGGKVRCLSVSRLSKVKVRKFGNAYRVDPHHDFSARWDEANIGRILNDLWRYRGRPGGLLLFIGFAAELEPFSGEFGELQSGTAFRQRFSRAIVRTWDDPHGRGFKVIAALWHVTANHDSK